MAALAQLMGELVSENGCLRLKTREDRPSKLLIWRPTDDMTADQQGVRITDEFGEFRYFYVGEKLLVGGGEAKTVKYVLMPIPSNCPGPYWIVGADVVAYTE